MREDRFYVKSKEGKTKERKKKKSGTQGICFVTLKTLKSCTKSSDLKFGPARKGKKTPQI